MVCTECGARVSEADQFCPECGAKVIKKRRCPDCGTPLRQDNKFCPKCGRLVGEKKKARPVSQDTMDIPMESIERNILSETAAEIRTERRSDRDAHKSAPGRHLPHKGLLPGSLLPENLLPKAVWSETVPPGAGQIVKNRSEGKRQSRRYKGKNPSRHRLQRREDPSTGKRLWKTTGRMMIGMTMRKKGLISSRS